MTELITITEIIVNATGAAVPAREVIATEALNDEQWESVLVETSGTVIALANQYGEWLINDGTGDAQIDDHVVEVPADLAVGQIYNVQGLSSYAYGSFELRATQIEQQVVLAPCVLGTVYVSEAHTSGEPEDYIELYNSGNTACNLAGFQLDDNVALTDLTFGDVTIEAGGYWIGYEDAENSFGSGLSSGGDIVVLADPTGDIRVVELGPSLAHYGQSFDADGNGCYADPTPGADNAECQETELITTGDLGCTYPGACNYDSEALFDDGSCEFLAGDLNGDHFVTASDLLMFLANFQATCE